jgi:hypothetical protein
MSVIHKLKDFTFDDRRQTGGSESREPSSAGPDPDRSWHRTRVTGQSRRAGSNFSGQSQCRFVDRCFGSQFLALLGHQQETTFAARFLVKVKTLYDASSHGIRI